MIGGEIIDIQITPKIRGGDLEVRFPSIVSTSLEQPVQAINTKSKQPITGNIDNYREYVIKKIKNNPCNMIYNDMIYNDMIYNDKNL